MQSMATQDGGPVDPNGAEESLWLRDPAAILRFNPVLFYTDTLHSLWPRCNGLCHAAPGAAGAPRSVEVSL